MERKQHWKLVFLGLTAALFVAMILCTALGPAPISPVNAAKILFREIPGGANIIPAGEWPQTHETIIVQMRLARVILGVLVGASLATSGVILQGLLQNPMGDPYILGISSGAALGAALAILFGFGSGVFGVFTIPAMAFLGGGLTTFIVYNIARVGNKVPMATVLLAGVAVGAFFSALTSLSMVLSGQNLDRVVFWLMGGLAGRGWEHVIMLLPYIIAGILPVFLFARDLNVLLLGEESAQHLGIEVERLKKILLGAATLLAAAAVAVSGIIGFVGLIIPHIVRILVGPDHRVLLPASALVGAIFLCVTDAIARVAAAPMEIPVGVITALCGGPFFLYLLRKRKEPGL